MGHKFEWEAVSLAICSVLKHRTYGSRTKDIFIQATYKSVCNVYAFFYTIMSCANVISWTQKPVHVSRHAWLLNNRPTTANVETGLKIKLKLYVFNQNAHTAKKMKKKRTTEVWIGVDYSGRQFVTRCTLHYVDWQPTLIPLNALWQRNDREPLTRTRESRRKVGRVTPKKTVFYRNEFSAEPRRNLPFYVRRILTR